MQTHHVGDEYLPNRFLCQPYFPGELLSTRRKIKKGEGYQSVSLQPNLANWTDMLEERLYIQSVTLQRSLRSFLLLWDISPGTHKALYRKKILSAVANSTSDRCPTCDLSLDSHGPYHTG
jgi:hypothetical protein